MPDNVLDAWVARPSAQRREVFDQWWWSLTEQRREEARALRTGDEMPYWMWRTLNPEQRFRPSLTAVRAGQVTVAVPHELRTLIRQWR